MLKQEADDLATHQYFNFPNILIKKIIYGMHLFIRLIYIRMYLKSAVIKKIKGMVSSLVVHAIY